MFNTADVLFDEYARPIFVIEEKIEPGNLVMKLSQDNSISFVAQGKKIGTLRDIDESILILSLMQDEIGIIAHDKNDEIPNTYTHIAKLIDESEVN
jgi:ABC-type antimicrobial peptide transport system ATPase subunit